MRSKSTYGHVNPHMHKLVRHTVIPCAHRTIHIHSQDTYTQITHAYTNMYPRETFRQRENTYALNLHVQTIHILDIHIQTTHVHLWISTHAYTHSRNIRAHRENRCAHTYNYTRHAYTIHTDNFWVHIHTYCCNQTKGYWIRNNQNGGYK